MVTAKTIARGIIIVAAIVLDETTEQNNCSHTRIVIYDSSGLGLVWSSDYPAACYHRQLF